MLPSGRHPSHNLILNKYPVIPGHCIVSTIEFKRQTDLLDDSDLAITHACLRSWEASSSESQPLRLFAFFNSGEHSGASQPHRHLQLLPIEEMVDPSAPKAWRPLIEMMRDPFLEHRNLNHISSLPLQHFAMKIPERPTAEQLGHIYHKLLDTAQNAASSWLTGSASDITGDGQSGTDASISYNLAMITDKMAICPRQREVANFPTERGEGSVALNGTVLGGTLMVKERSEWDTLRHGHVDVDDILEQVGIPLPAQLARSLDTRL